MQRKKEIRKIMLIHTTGKVLKSQFHQCEIPLGLAYLAAVLRNDFEVKVLDGRAKPQRIVPKNSKWEYFGYSPREIIEQVKAYDADIVGIGCLASFHFPDVVDLVNRIKKIKKDVITITGGTHPTFLVQDIMQKHENIDFIVLGEGERTFPQLCQCLKNGRSYADLNGLAFRNSGNIRINPRTEYISDLDSLPYPAFDLFPLDFYWEHKVPFSITSRCRRTAPIMTSRGCPSQCVFCASRNYWGDRYRMRSVESVLDEVEHLVQKYGIEEIQFIDDNLTCDKKRARAIFEGIIERKLDISWSTPNGVAVWTLDEELIRLMKKSGCYELAVAFESGDQDVLNNIIKKPLNLANAVEKVKLMKKLGLQVRGFFISGFPNETIEQIKRTFDFANNLDIDSAWFFVANPTPGSRLYDICIEKGYIDKNMDFEDIEYHISHFATEHFSREQIQALVRKQSGVFVLKCFLRHPLKFMRLYLNVMIRHPIMFFRQVFFKLQSIFHGKKYE